MSSSELSETADICTALYRNPMQACNFGGAFDQVFFWFFYVEKKSLFLFQPWCKSQKRPKLVTQNKGVLP